MMLSELIEQKNIIYIIWIMNMNTQISDVRTKEKQ